MTLNENEILFQKKLKIKETIFKLYSFMPDDNAILRLFEWERLFIDYNSHTNLMSKNDIPFLFEKHVLDSLSIVLLKEFKDEITLLDAGAGGGFPSLILAIFFPQIQVIAIDSTGKKVRFLEIAKKRLNLSNFQPVCTRIEKIEKLKADIITNRAVGKIPYVWDLCKHNLKKGGSFVSYKAKNAKEEAVNLKGLSAPEFIYYNLPVENNPARVLVKYNSF